MPFVAKISRPLGHARAIYHDQPKSEQDNRHGDDASREGEGDFFHRFEMLGSRCYILNDLIELAAPVKFVLE